MHMKKLLLILGATFFALAGCVQVSPENSDQTENNEEELPIEVIDNTDWGICSGRYKPVFAIG